jgi:hypothetical protein
MKLNTLRFMSLGLAVASLISCGTPSGGEPVDGASGGSAVQGTAGTQGSGGASAGSGGSGGGGGGAGSVAAGRGGASAGGTGGAGGGTGGEVGGANGGSAASGRGGATAGTSGSAGASGRGGTSGTAGTTGAAGAAGTGGSGRGGASGAGGSPLGGNGGAGATGGAAGLPQLTVNGTKLQDPSGKTIVLRGSALIDIGALYYYGGQNVSGITTRMDKVAAAGVQGHVVRLPVYPKIDYNGGSPTCSPCPYPVGTGPVASCTPTTPVSASDYVTKILKPAVDYATSKNLYVIIDFHQIDNATAGTSAADATTFWTDIAPRFASYTNVIYEPFNEPLDTGASWAALKSVAQGWINTIRAAAPKNIIIVPSNNWDQRPGDAASDPPMGTNLMYTAHVYPSNWKSGNGFQTQVATAVTKAPVFMTEWGYDRSDPASWGTALQSTIDANGASWTAWVTDNGWTPSMFADSSLTTLTSFGTLVKTWLAAKANSDWVQ